MGSYTKAILIYTLGFKNERIRFIEGLKGKLSKSLR